MTKKHPWKLEVGENATIRFLDPDPLPSSIYIKIFPVEIPDADHEVVFTEVKEVLYGCKTGRMNTVLHPDVKQWCIDNLKGRDDWMLAGDSFRTATVRNSRREDGSLAWRVDFQTDTDATLFKLRWIGTPA